MKKLLLIILLVITGSIWEATGQSKKEPVGDLLYSIIESKGVDAAVDKFRELNEMRSEQYDLGQQQLNNLGYRLLSEDKDNAAVSIFKLNAEVNPASINVWDSLGEGYLIAGKNELAIKQYKKVLEMLDSDTTLPSPAQNFFRNNAKDKIFVAKHFDRPSEDVLHYVSYYGGVPAGKWDMQNILDFKKLENIKLSYSGNNFYRSPVPKNVEETLTGANPPDVTSGSMAGDYRRYIERGFIADISDLWQEEGWDDVFPESFKKMASVDGKQYFVPMAYQWNPVWYRKDIFENHGLTPPETWEELLDLCDQLNELGYTPFTIGVQNWPPPTARWFSTLNLRLNGPEFHEQVMKGEVSYTDDRIRNVFAHWRELFRNDAFADSSFANNYQAGIKALTSGSAVMYNLGEWIFESLNEKQAAKLDFFAFPEINPQIKQAEIVHAYGAFLRSGNSNPDKSKALLRWLASSESQESNVKANSRVVANMKVDQSIYSDVQKRIINHINNTEVLVPLFELNTHPDFASKALSIFQDYWEHPEDIDSTMERLEEARQQVFESLSEKDITEIRTVLNTYATGWNAENPKETILDLFVDDAVLLPHHGAAQVKGKENIRKHFWPAGLTGFKVNSYNFDIREITGNGNLAYSSGRYSISFSFENNGEMKTLNNAGNYVMIFRQLDDGWKISRYIWNDPVQEE